MWLLPFIVYLVKLVQKFNMKKLLAALMSSAILATSLSVTAMSDTGSKKVTAIISSNEVK